MAMTTLSANAQPFIPASEQEALEALVALGIDMNAQTNQSNDLLQAVQNIVEQVDNQSSAQHEYEDAFLEYAYENGLWGLPGSETEPSENEFSEMRQQFAEHWINVHGYDENINYGLEIEHQEEEDINNEFDGGDETDDDMSMEEEEDTDEVGYYFGENSPRTWNEIAIDFQDFSDERGFLTDPSNASFHDVDHAWDEYLDTCWHGVARHWLTQLGEASNWLGVYTQEQIDAHNQYYGNDPQQ